ncbi:unnamed protein product [Auanema sp. JU1783]|nr:unnamed protein product [Auanema sp. JU1783]
MTSSLTRRQDSTYKILDSFKTDYSPVPTNTSSSNSCASTSHSSQYLNLTSSAADTSYSTCCHSRSSSSSDPLSSNTASEVIIGCSEPEPKTSLRPGGGGGVEGGASRPTGATRWADPRGSSTAVCRMVATVPFEPLKWAFLLIYLVVAGLSNWAVLAYTHDYVPRDPLPDIIFWLVPEQQWATAWGDLMVTLCLLCLLVLLFFHEQRIVIARRVIFIAATLYAMRSCTLMVTQLPSGYENNTQRCRERLDSPDIQTFFERLGEQTLRLGFQGGTQMLCGDLLFSGHTLVMIVCTITVAYYLPNRWRLLQWIPTIFSIFGMSCMAISRTHYTIDIIVAYWLTNFIFRVYHAYCEVDIYIERRRSVLHDLWLCRVIAWLEESIVPGKIENRFTIPFSHYLRAPGHHKQISIA